MVASDKRELRDDQVRLKSSESTESGPHSGYGHWHECKPDRFSPGDLPEGWRTSSESMCGVTWPSETPLEAISECCSGPVQVSKGCFHYCATDFEDGAFSLCAVQYMDAEHIGATCHHPIVSSVNGPTTWGPTWTVGIAEVMIGYSAKLIYVALGVLVACLIIQCLSTSAAERRKLWRWIGIILSVLALWILCQTQGQ